MVRKILMALVVAMSCLIPIGIFTASPANAAISCVHGVATDQRDMNVQNPVLPFFNTKYRVEFTLRGRNCANQAGYRLADPQTLTFSCKRVDGPVLAALDEIRFNGFMYDENGKTLNPGPMALNGCNSPEWQDEVQYFETATWFKRCAAGPPRIDVDVTADVIAGDDGHTSLTSTFWWYVGPIIMNC